MVTHQMLGGFVQEGLMAGIPEWLLREVNDYFCVPIGIQPETIMDIGANIGAFAVRAHLEWARAKIIAYEPISVNARQLRQNTDSKWCQVNECAVRALSGDSEICIGDMFVTSGFVQSLRTTSMKTIVCCEAASNLPSCDLVKIDTEGCEVEILENLDLSNTKAIFLEHHSYADAKKIVEILSSEFRLAHDETDRPVGTEIYLRK